MTRKPVCCTIYTALVRFRRKSEFLPNLPIKYDHFAVMLHYFFQELWCHYSFTKRQYWNWNISYARCYQKFRPSCRNHRPSAHEHSLCYLYAYVGRLCQYSMSKNQNQIFGLCPSGRSSIFNLRNTICKIFKYCKVSCCQGECRHGIFSCFFLTDLFWDSEQGNRSHIMQDLFIAPTLFTVVYHNEIKIPESNFFLTSVKNWSLQLTWKLNEAISRKI